MLNVCQGTSTALSRSFLPALPASEALTYKGSNRAASTNSRPRWGQCTLMLLSSQACKPLEAAGMTLPNVPCSKLSQQSGSLLTAAVEASCQQWRYQRCQMKTGSHYLPHPSTPFSPSSSSGREESKWRWTGTDCPASPENWPHSG